MGKPGAKKLDQILSVTPGDVHIIMVPSPAGPVPTPIPHPVPNSMIKDKVAKKVKVMGQPGAVKGSKSQHTPPHIPMGPGPFQKPPGNKGEIMTGSSNVFYEGKAAAMLGDTGKMCMDPSDAPVGKVIGKAATVLVGGGGSGGGGAGSGSAASKKASNAKTGRIEDATVSGHPINVATGDLLITCEDFDLDGPLAAQFVRTYNSATSHRKSSVGFGWSHNLEESMELVSRGHPSFKELQERYEEAGSPAERGEYLVHRDANGVGTSFHAPAEGEVLFDEASRQTLTREGNSLWLGNRFGVQSRFSAVTKDKSTLQLVDVIDRNGNRNAYSYDLNGILSSIRDCYGRVLVLQYDTAGRVSAVCFSSHGSADREIIASFAYDECGDLVEVVKRGDARTRYNYTDHLITQDQDPAGYSFFFNWDETRRCIQTWGQDGYLTRYFQYDSEELRTLETNGEGESTLYHYTDVGVVFRTEKGQDCTTEITHDDLGREVSRSCNGRITGAYEYDDAGNIVALIDGENNATNFEYDDFGQVTKLKDPLGRESFFTYDDRGNMTLRSEPGGTTHMAYDERGRLTRRENADGTLTEYGYDNFGSETMVRFCGHGTIRTCDASGLPQTEMTPDGEQTLFEWDDHGFPIRIKVDGVQVACFEWDARGGMTSSTDNAGTTREYRYQRPGIVSEMAEYEVDDNGVRVERFRLTMESDLEGRPRRVIDHDGRAHSFEYDDAGRMIGEIGHHGYRRTFSYDGPLLVSKICDEAGHTTHFEYNGGGLLSRIVYDDEREEVFEYDECQRLVSAMNGWGEIATEYGEDDRAISQRQGDFESSSSIDKDSRKMTWSSSDDVASEWVVDEKGNLESIVFGGRSFRFGDYDGAWARRRELPSGLVERYAYDPFESVASIDLEREGVRVNQTRLRYDRRMRLRGVEDMVLGDREFEYDSLGRLTRVSGALDERYEYDERDNLIASSQFDSSWVRGDQLSAAGHRAYDYDECGNVIQISDPKRGTFRIHYDGKGQLARVDLPDGGSVSYEYDAIGRRVEKSFRDGAREGQRVLFFWTGEQLAKEERWSGDDRISEHFFLHQNQRPLARLDRDLEGERIIYFHTDRAGTAGYCTNEMGEVIWRFDGNPYGYEANRRDGFQNLRLPGQYYDEETGFHYNRYRYYDPYTARYLQPDPLASLTDYNRYDYPRDPFHLIDPLGLTTMLVNCDPTDAVIRNGSGIHAGQLQSPGRALFGSGSPSLAGVSRLVVHGHGSGHGIEVQTWTGRLFGWVPGVRGTKMMNGEEFAKYLKKRGFRGNEVVLVSCHQGAPGSTFAQDMAKELGSGKNGNPNVQVTAWAGPVGVMPNGGIRALGPTTRQPTPTFSNKPWYTRWYHRAMHRPVSTARPHREGARRYVYDARGNRTARPPPFPPGTEFGPTTPI